MKEKISVLLVDDDEDQHFIIKRILNSVQHVDYKLHYVSKYEAGLTALLEHKFDVGLVDYHLGSENGLDLIKAAIDAGCELPLILMTGQGNHDIDISAMEIGAMDYLNKDEVNAQALERTIRYAIERKKTENQLRKLNFQLQYISENDLLTDLANRHKFNNEFPLITERCIRHQTNLAIMFLDLDHFKEVNDTYGHSYGDLLLRQVADRLKKELRKIDFIYRMGGDEFVILVEDIETKKHVALLAERLIKLLAAPFYLNEQVVFISASIGIVIADEETCMLPQALIKAADNAMYKAKQLGRNNFQFATEFSTEEN